MTEVSSTKIFLLAFPAGRSLSFLVLLMRADLVLTLKRYSSAIASEIKYVAEKCYFKKYTFVEAAEWEYSK
jgi:hypothetical protein